MESKNATISELRSYTEILNMRSGGQGGEYLEMCGLG